MAESKRVKATVSRKKDSISPKSAEQPLSDVVARQYEEWVYPEPIVDLPGWLANNWQWFDPSHSSRMFWPDREYRHDLQLLVAGCGTNQAAVFAYTNPGARVVAIDVSSSSLGHHQFLKNKYGLSNLELHQLPIEEVSRLESDFDLIVSTGVLHHLLDPKIGFQALAACLRKEGVLAVMLYARYGRIGVEMLQGVFRDLGLKQDEASLAVIREALQLLPPDHPLRSYMAVAPDLQYPAGLVDTFLHGRDRSFTVSECLDLVRSAGLLFQDWFLKSSYEPSVLSINPFFDSLAELSDEQRWGVMERINHRNGCHFFTACRQDRRLESYKFNFLDESILDCIPMFRYRCGLKLDHVIRPGWSMVLTPEQIALMQLVDGRRTLREIVQTASLDPACSGQSPSDVEQAARTIVRALINRDVMTLAITKV